MAAKPDDAPAEHVQIVVRHGHSEEEGHHGGVWKIAYADFMTAMMAFFLVMWLVNASNTEMKASVASYFNPIKLSDNVIRKKGLRDVDGKANAEEGSKAPAPKSSGKEAANSASQPLQPGEAVKLGADETPGAAGEPTDASFGRDGNASQGGRAAESGRAFRDPFNPFAPGQLMALEGSGKEAMTVTPPGRSGAPRDPVADSPGTTGNPGRFAEWLRHGPFGTPLPEPAGGTESSSPKSVASGQQSRIVEVPAGAGEAASVIDRTSGEVRSADTKSSDSPVGAPAGKAPAGAGILGEIKPKPAGSGAEAVGGKADRPSSAAAKEKAKLESAAAGLLREIKNVVKTTAGDGGPGIDVRIEGKGIVLSLTDTSTFGMFAIGSAEPSRETIDLINRIAPVIASNSRSIVLRGHTDSRAYRTEKSNNWRLSVSRAEAAYAMLVRAGIEEARFDRIEGYADRKLRDPGNPGAAKNRRIEVLLQQVGE